MRGGAVLPRFAAGDPVTVLPADRPGHVRTPAYIRGRRGIVERLCGSFPNPESLAYGNSGLPLQPLYRVRFLQCEVWPDYDGHPGDTLDIEIFQHWLDEAPRAP
jgi:nitrile hydratase subunit beta